MDIGKKIAYLRKTRNITQAQLAEYLSVTPQTISRWEANNGVPDVYLLPDIAAFFDVSIEELFGIDHYEKVNSLVYRYSILRNENSYEAAMAAINRCLDSAPDKERCQQLMAQKMHMYLQKSRAYLDKADELANTLLEETQEINNPLHMAVRFQKIQFSVLQGNASETIAKLHENYTKHPSHENVMLYMCALHEAFRYDDVLALYSSDVVQELIQRQDNAAGTVWDMLFFAAYQKNDLLFFRKHFEEFKRISDADSMIHTKISYAKVLKQHNMIHDADVLKKQLLEDISVYQKNELLYNLFVEKISAI